MHGYEVHFSASNIEANATVRSLAQFQFRCCCRPSCTVLAMVPDVAYHVQGVFNKESLIMKLLQEATIEEVSHTHD